jgi:hypothetical protein
MQVTTARDLGRLSRNEQCRGGFETHPYYAIFAFSAVNRRLIEARALNLLNG